MPLQSNGTETEVANEALSLIRKPRLVSIVSDVTEAARVTRLHFPNVRDGLLRRYPWNFAEAYVLLEASATPPPFGWLMAYPIPADCAAVRSVFACNSNDWKVSGRQIFTDRMAPLKVVYTQKKTEPGTWDALFHNVFVNTLAARIGPELSAEEDRIKACSDAAGAALIDAFGIDAMEAIDLQEAQFDALIARDVPVIAWDPLLIGPRRP